MKTDDGLEKEIWHIIAQEPLLKGARISVMLKGDEVLLTGCVNHFAKKAVAINAVRGMNLRLSITDEINVIPDNPEMREDEKILSEVSAALEKNLGEASANVTILISKGFIELFGQVKWHYQKELATECISGIKGVKSIINNITTFPHSDEMILKKNIITALKMVFQDDITAEVKGGEVILTGKVKFQYQIGDIDKIIKNIAGVSAVANHLTVE